MVTIQIHDMYFDVSEELYKSLRLFDFWFAGVKLSIRLKVFSQKGVILLTLSMTFLLKNAHHIIVYFWIPDPLVHKSLVVLDRRFAISKIQNHCRACLDFGFLII